MQQTYSMPDRLCCVKVNLRYGRNDVNGVFLYLYNSVISLKLNKIFFRIYRPLRLQDSQPSLLTVSEFTLFNWHLQYHMSWDIFFFKKTFEVFFSKNYVKQNTNRENKERPKYSLAVNKKTLKLNNKYNTKQNILKLSWNILYSLNYISLLTDIFLFIYFRKETFKNTWGLITREFLLTNII